MPIFALFLALILSPYLALAQTVAKPIADVTVTGTATLIKARTDDRVTLSCTNTHASVHVRWGNSTVTAAVGQRIPAGSAIEISSRGAIYMISEGANVTVSCTEELK